MFGVCAGASAFGGEYGAILDDYTPLFPENAEPAAVSAAPQGIYASYYAPNGVMQTGYNQNVAFAGTNVAYAEDAEAAPAAPLSTEDQLAELQAQFKELQAEVKKKQDKADSTKKFIPKIGGIIIADALAVDQSGGTEATYGDINNGFPLREARIIVKGEGYKYFSYECGFALQNSLSQYQAGLLCKNIYVQAKEVPIFGSVKAGHMKVETCMSERDQLINAPGISYFSGNTMSFSPHRRFGIGSMTTYLDKRLRWWNGFYAGRGFTDAAAVLDDAPGYIINTRLTGVPILREDANGDLEEVLHIGGSAYWYVAGNGTNTVKVRARPTAWYGAMPYLLSGTINLERGYNVKVAEMAWQRGQLGIVSENFVADYQDHGTAWASTLALRCFLTEGCYRTYSTTGGGFGNAHIANNISRKEGNKGLCPDDWGAFEVVTMYSYTDMDNLENVSGATYGTMHEGIVGLNWWLCPDLRISATYTQAYCDSAKVGKEKQRSNNNTTGIQMNFQY